MKLPRIKLPQVHIAVNVAGLLAGLSSITTFIVANPAAPVALGVPTKDVAGIVAIAGLIAAFLPTKRAPASSGAAVPEAPKSTEGNK